MDEHLILKWGTLKGWKVEGEAARGILQRYFDLGTSMGAMTQVDTPEQRLLICELIDAIDGPITNDWTGETMTRDEAKRYVTEYRR